MAGFWKCHNRQTFTETALKMRTAGYLCHSDALRYEVAASLAEQLRRETQADVKLQDVQGIFPTITKFGMAALLPHKELEVSCMVKS